MKENKLPSFITFPRSIVSDFRDGKLSRTEFIAYVWIRLNANPYAIAIVSLESVREDIFPKLKRASGKNFINKILLSLRTKNYIHFNDRRGQRGSFEVRFGDWKLPNGAISTLDKATQLPITKVEERESKSKEEVKNNLSSPSQKFIEVRKEIAGRSFSFPGISQVRSPHNEHEHQNEHYKNDTLENASKGTLVSQFIPKTYEDERIKTFATELNEKYINPFQALYRQYGLPALEDAVGIYKEDLANRRTIDNPGAYITGILKNRAKANGNSP